jgi:hypothetical protein
MNKSERFSLLICILICGAVFGQCDVSKIVSLNKGIISNPYQYDGFLIQDIPFVASGTIPKEIHSEFIAFKKQTYKVVFCAAGFDEDENVHITIYNKKKPTKVVAEQTINSKLTRWIFEPLKPGIYDIVYTPDSSSFGIEHKGCIIMLIGFKK